jgi:TM2 domain-containing membrane protein YozV
MLVLEIGIFIACWICVGFDYLIYKYVKLEYDESKSGNQLLKKLLNSRKRSTAKALVKEILKPETVS